MSNKFITPEEMAKDTLRVAKESIKKYFPDKPGQVEEFNEEQGRALIEVLNAFSKRMFYGGQS
jgi:hypothetical protein